MSDAVRLECIEDPAYLDTVGEAWDALLAASATRSPFLVREWLSTWWSVFGADFALRLLLVRSARGDLLAAAPLMTGAGPGRLRGRLAHLMFVGQRGETLAEHLDVLVRTEAPPETVDLLADGVLDATGAWEVLLLERVPAASRSASALERRLRARGLAIGRVRAQDSPYLPLPATWDEVLASRSRNFRSQWKNGYNRLAKAGTVRLLLAGRDLEVDEAFEDLVGLHRARWGEGAGSFRTPRYLDFHRRLSRAFAARDGLLLALLEVGGKKVAARYDFLHDGKVWCFQGGWLPEYERMRAGTVLTGLVMEWAIDHGYREYDFLSGEDGYKRRWASGSRTLVDLEAFRAGARTGGYRLFRRLRDGWRRLRGGDQAARGSL